MVRAMFLVGLAVALPLAAAAAEDPAARQAWFGDLHLHTGFSVDAFTLGGTTVTPDQAYEYGAGKPVTVLGRTLQRRRPLDFMAVTDHAENMGLGLAVNDPATPAGRTPLGDQVRSGAQGRIGSIRTLMSSKQLPDIDIAAVKRDSWAREIEAVKKHYVPGRFTTLLAFEWTSMPDNQNLHRNVIFRGTEGAAPFSQLDSLRPEDLWSYLEKNRKRGIEAMAIPHNGNVSNGLMYDWVDSDGRPIDRAYAIRRALNEPLTEIGQIKGQSETHPLLSPEDEFANFELFETLLADSRRGKVSGSYVREAYGRGLVLAARTGVNPYKYGVVGASDLHNGIDDADEDRYVGSHVGDEVPNREEAERLLGFSANTQVITELATGSGNLTGVWAAANNREAIYDALRRKETFATSGPQIKVRLFGGWTFADDLMSRPDWVQTAYAAGTPMGGDLPKRPARAGAPRFLLWAAKDPDGNALERLQIVKVWLDGDAAREKVFDVKVAPANSAGTVLGVAEFAALWSDPAFVESQAAVYYVRVLQIPTLRWSTLLAARLGLPAPQNVPATIRERAWSSPVWYVP